jgi:hypothetical protein
MRRRRRRRRKRRKRRSRRRSYQSVAAEAWVRNQAIHVGFVVGKVALGRVSLLVLRVSRSI